jgi:hypothetical protein
MEPRDALADGQMMSALTDRGGDVLPAPGRPIDDPRVCRLLRRLGLFTLLLLVLGAACGWAVQSLFAHSSGSDLRKHGVRASGLVVHVQPERKNDPERIDVRYVADRERVGRVNGDPLGRAFDVGQPVTVYYDPKHPERLTVGGGHNLGGLAWLAVLHLGALAVALLAAAGNMALRVVRWRWLLTRGRWRRFAAVATPTPFSRGHNAFILLRSVDDLAAPAQVVSAGWGPCRRPLTLLSDLVWVLGDGNLVILSTLGDAGIRDLYSARRPLSRWQNRRWRRHLPDTVVFDGARPSEPRRRAAPLPLWRQEQQPDARPAHRSGNSEHPGCGDSSQADHVPAGALRSGDGRNP